MEERDFLYEMCLAALCMSREVKFAAVIDNNGKLIVGKYRKKIQNKPARPPDDITATAAFCQYNTSYLFYTKYLIPSIKNKNERKRSNGENAETVHFQLAEVHGSLKIAITPLTESNDKYLCIYLESSSPNQELIAKLSSTI
jgi:hypothetical protein